ncbi:DUF4339 domain-containing protein [Roseivirga sp. BDSF3-8]|uniref:DUF4339 domain-containing protein n=1 Tax=Roseivirga sp. BDSF3-8 TaxID=3241598 RepID=UPI0035319F41
MEYFISDGKNQQGPYSLEDLKMMRLTPDTMIWHEGLDDWQPAKFFSDLRDCFRIATPPPIKKKKKNIGLKLFLVLIILCLGFVFAMESLRSESYFDDKYSIERYEKARPASFLQADGTYRENFWGNRYKIECKVSNKASVASYKDVVVEFTYYSKTKTVLLIEEKVLYEVFPPNSNKTFDLKLDAYSDVSSIGWKVKSAVAL